MKSNRLPALFIGHGSPMNAIEDNRHTRAWQQIGASMPRPAAILMVSAHWYTNGTGVTAMREPRTIHDFYGFPPELFAIRYPAPGAPALAQRVQTLLEPVSVTEDHEWGLDHGAWSVLVRMFPSANIPVVQLSIDASQPAEFHYRLGQQLAVLRDEGVMLMGSGNVVHNLRLLDWHATGEGLPWATEFNERIRNAITSGDHQAAINYGTDEAARLSVPTPEHYLPLLYVLGASAGERAAFPTDGIELGSISMLSVQYG
jgi:4,5-DOPA dioxygenase extradiol